MNRLITVIVGGTALLTAAAVVVVLRINCRQPAPLLPAVPVAQTPAEVRVKAVERNSEPLEQGAVEVASSAVAAVCGNDANAGRY